MTGMHQRPAERSADVMAAMLAGRNDCEIVREFGFCRQTVRRMRKRFGIEPMPRGHNGGTVHWSPITAEMDARIRAGLKAGRTDRGLARELGIDRSAITRRRDKWGFPKCTHGVNETPYSERQSRSRPMPQPIRPERDPLYARIKRAMAFNPDPSIQLDAIHDLYADVLSGDVREADIEKLARRYTGRVVAQYADRWGAVSLDEDIGGEGDGFSRYAYLADPDTGFVMDMALYRGLSARGVRFASTMPRTQLECAA